jgi:histidine triad (HIT) family protein
MPEEEACIFCRIISGELPSYKIYEDDYVFVILDIHPVGRGHTLIITKNHYPNVYSIPEEIQAYVYQIAKRIAEGQQKAWSPPGISIVQNNGSAAGQVIFHFHTHVIPKNSPNQERYPTTEEDLTKVAEELKRTIGV